MTRPSKKKPPSIRPRSSSSSSSFQKYIERETPLSFLFYFLIPQTPYKRESKNDWRQGRSSQGRTSIGAPFHVRPHQERERERERERECEAGGLALSAAMTSKT